MTMTKPKAPGLEVGFTLEQTPDEVRSILWRIASDLEQSGTARVAACRCSWMPASGVMTVKLARMPT
jgi:hypothetical protein